jgi:hypothetical protein
MNKTVTLTEEQARIVMQALDAAVRSGGLNAVPAILPVASSIESQLTAEKPPEPK